MTKLFFDMADGGPTVPCDLTDDTTLRDVYNIAVGIYHARIGASQCLTVTICGDIKINAMTCSKFDHSTKLSAVGLPEFGFGNRAHVMDACVPVFVKPPNSGSVVFNVNSVTRVGELRQFVADTCGIPADKQRLHYGGKDMINDSDTLFDYGVARDATIQVLLRLLGGGKRTRKLMDMLKTQQKQIEALSKQLAAAQQAAAGSSSDSSSESSSSSDSSSSEDDNEDDYDFKPISNPSSKAKGKGKAKAPPKKRAKIVRAPPKPSDAAASKPKAKAKPSVKGKSPPRSLASFKNLLHLGRRIISESSDALHAVCATKHAMHAGSDWIKPMPSGSIKVGCKHAALRDELTMIDCNNRDNPEWMVHAARMECPTDALNYLFNANVRGKDALAYMAVDDKFALALQPFLGGAFPILHDGRTIDSLKPCSVCGFTGSYTATGVRSPFVECEGASCCTDPADCHAHCAFGHCHPTDDDHWCCCDCGGSSTPAATAAPSGTVSDSLDKLPFQDLGAGAFQVVKINPDGFPNIFGIVAWPSIAAEDDAPTWVDINYIMEAAVVRQQHVDRGNIRPLASHPKTMDMRQRFHESRKSALPSKLCLTDETRTFAWRVACHGTNLLADTFTNTMRPDNKTILNCPDACEHAKKLALPTKKPCKHCKCHKTCNWVVFWYPGFANTLSLLNVYSDHFDLMLNMLKAIDTEQKHIDGFVAQWINSDMPYPPFHGKHFGSGTCMPERMHANAQWRVREHEYDADGGGERAPVAYTGAISSDHWCKLLNDFARAAGHTYCHVIFANDTTCGKEIAPSVYLIQGHTAVSAEISIPSCGETPPPNKRARFEAADDSEHDSDSDSQDEADLDEHEQDEDYVHQLEHAQTESDSESEDDEAQSPTKRQRTQQVAATPLLSNIDDEPFKDCIRHPDMPSFVILLLYGKYPDLITAVYDRLAATASVGTCSAHATAKFMRKMSPLRFNVEHAASYWTDNFETSQHLTRSLIAITKQPHTYMHMAKHHFDTELPPGSLGPKCLHRCTNPELLVPDDAHKAFVPYLQQASNAKSVALVLGGDCAMAAHLSLDIDLIVYETNVEMYSDIENNTGGVDTRVIVPFSWRMPGRNRFYNDVQPVCVFSEHKRFRHECGPPGAGHLRVHSWPMVSDLDNDVTIVANHDDISTLCGDWQEEDLGTVSLFTRLDLKSSAALRDAESSDSDSDDDSNSPLAALAAAASPRKIARPPAPQAPLPPPPSPRPTTVTLQLFVKDNPMQADGGIAFEFTYNASKLLRSADLVQAIDVPRNRELLRVPQDARLVGLLDCGGAGIGKSVNGHHFVLAQDFIQRERDQQVFVVYDYERVNLTLTCPQSDAQPAHVVAWRGATEQQLHSVVNVAPVLQHFGIPQADSLRIAEVNGDTVVLAHVASTAHKAIASAIAVTRAAAEHARTSAVAAAIHSARAAAKSATQFLKSCAARADAAFAAAAAAQRAKQCADAADEARRSAELAATVRQAVTHTIQDMVSSVASEPFKHCFDFDDLPAKKLKYLVQQLKSKIDAEPPATHKGKAPMIHWLQASPEKQLRDVVVKALPAAQLDSFVHEHFPHATCKADIM